MGVWSQPQLLLEHTGISRRSAREGECPPPINLEHFGSFHHSNVLLQAQHR